MCVNTPSQKKREKQRAKEKERRADERKGRGERTEEKDKQVSKKIPRMNAGDKDLLIKLTGGMYVR